MKLSLQTISLGFVLIEFLHHLTDSTVQFICLLFNCDILHTHSMSMYDLTFSTFQLFLQSLDLFQKLLVIALFSLNILFRVSRNHRGPLCKS
jgi:hypothetical protein